MKTIGVIFEAAKTVIATGAEKASHFASNVIVVDGKIVFFASSRINRHVGIATTCTFAFLSGHHVFELVMRQSISSSAATVLVAGLLLPIVHVLGFASSTPCVPTRRGRISSPAKLLEGEKTLASSTAFAICDWHVEEIGGRIRRIALHREPRIHGARAASVARRLPISFPILVV
jgi:hypothetical protein